MAPQSVWNDQRVTSEATSPTVVGAHFGRTTHPLEWKREEVVWTMISFVVLAILSFMIETKITQLKDD